MTITVTEREAKLIMRGLHSNAQSWHDMMHNEAADKEHAKKRFIEAMALIDKVRDQLNAQFDEMEAE